jgi:hypothetical protein
MHIEFHHLPSTQLTRIHLRRHLAPILHVDLKLLAAFVDPHRWLHVFVGRCADDRDEKRYEARDYHFVVVAFVSTSSVHIALRLLLS